MFRIPTPPGFRIPRAKILGIGESGFPSMAIYFDELFNTLADDHGGAESQLWGGGGSKAPVTFHPAVLWGKCYFLLLIARVYICTHFHIKRKRHRHFLGFSFAAKLDFSKIVATGRRQVKLSSSETIRIHYYRLLLQNSRRLSSQDRKRCNISFNVWMLGILWKREFKRLSRFFPV